LTDSRSLVLITRPRSDSESFAALLSEQGLDHLIEPMIEIEPVDQARVDLSNCQAILFTSANGVRAFADLSKERSLPVIAVGPASAAQARKVGFSDVTASGGNVERLAETVVEKLRPQRGLLFHAAGSVTAGDLLGLLSAEGFETRRQAIYRSVVATAFSSDARSAIKEGHVLAATFFSPRTAAAFARVIATEGLEVFTKDVRALCLSQAVADAAVADGLVWQEILVASATDQNAMAELACAALGRSKGIA